MKTPVKYIMSPLLFGGLVILLYFTIYARHTATSGENLLRKPLTGCHNLQNGASSFCIRMLKRLITH